MAGHNSAPVYKGLYNQQLKQVSEQFLQEFLHRARSYPSRHSCMSSPFVGREIAQASNDFAFCVHRIGHESTTWIAFSSSRR
jgi:hypothetical protein